MNYKCNCSFEYGAPAHEPDCPVLRMVTRATSSAPTPPADQPKAERRYEVRGYSIWENGKPLLKVFVQGSLKETRAAAQRLAERLNGYDLFQRATAYLVLMTAMEDKYWPDEIVAWAKVKMTGEKMSGGQLVEAATVCAKGE